jgi:GT2 family glycosyltransferase
MKPGTGGESSARGENQSRPPLAGGSRLVSIIVVSWNSKRFLEDCLASIRGQTHRHVETFVVDNGSKDGSADLVATKFNEVTLIRNETNAGFCKANNQALKRSSGDFILCLNADAVLDSDFLSQALRPFQEEPNLGFVAGKIRRFDEETLDSAGQILTRARRIRDRGYNTRDAGQFEHPEEIFSVCGAVALYSRAMVDSISREDQFFDESFFSFGEDMDVAWRARRAGFRGRYQPSATAKHFRGGSQSRGASLMGRFSQMTRRPTEIQAHIIKNRYLMMLKNDRMGAVLMDLPFILAWDLFQWTFLLFTSPSVIGRVWSYRAMLMDTWRRRRALSPQVKGA